MAFSSASFLLFFSSFMGASVMFLSTVMWGKRLKCWNTMPIFCRCTLMFTLGSVMSTPSKVITPLVRPQR